MKVNEKYVSKRIGERVAKLMEHFDSTIFWDHQIDWMLERVR